MAKWILSARKTLNGSTNEKIWAVNAKCSECGAPHPGDCIGGSYPDNCVYALLENSSYPDEEGKQLAMDYASHNLYHFCPNCGAKMMSSEPMQAQTTRNPNTVLWDKLRKHWGHNINVAVYGDPDNPDNVCLECEDCEEIILDAELYTLQARDDV